MYKFNDYYVLFTETSRYIRSRRVVFQFNPVHTIGVPLFEKFLHCAKSKYMKNNIPKNNSHSLIVA